MTTILAFDTTAGSCSVALWRDGETLARRSAEMMRGHAEALLPMIVDTLAGANLAFGGLDAVAVTTGPGAFTGIRIGLAAARGIALAAGIPAVGVGSIEAVAEGVGRSETETRALIVAIDTKRRDFYAQRFRPGPEASWLADGEPAALAGPSLIALAGSEPVLVAGDAAAAAAEALRAAAAEVEIEHEGKASGPPDPALVAACAARILYGGAPVPSPRPLYLREPEARLPKRAPALAP